MSFILDALKKSEAERQRKTIPGVADIPDARHAPRAQRWWWLIGALLAVNLAVLVLVFFRPAATPAVPANAAQLPADAPVTTQGDAPFADVLAEARQKRPDVEPTITTEPPRQAGTPSPPAQETARPVSSSEPAARPRGTTTMGEALATFDELRMDGSLMLPDLHLDIHVYSELAGERFVFINMRRYGENTALDEGPVVREILPEGVLLEHQGRRFLLPRR